MTNLSARERELVSLGAAMGSNCVPCMEFHIPEARKAGLSDPQIVEAVRVADKVRQVPARKVLSAALSILGESPEGAGAGERGASSVEPAPAGTKEAACCG